MAKTEISWTDFVWNPTRGCSRVSPGCGGAKGQGGCYAERQAARFAGPGGAYEGLVRLGKQGPRWTGAMRLVVEKLSEPMRWRKPKKIFVNSMSDLFHEGLTNEEIAAVFGAMAACPQHTFQVLTKRAKRMREWFEWVASFEGEHGPPPDDVVAIHASNLIDCDRVQRPWPLPNVWIGVSVEDQQRADERIPELQRVPSAVRFLSVEPMLGPVVVAPWLTRRTAIVHFEAFTPEAKAAYPTAPTHMQHEGVSWVIVGGESGPGARPFDPAWAESVIEQCHAASVACFVKQMGGHIAGSESGFGAVHRWHLEGGGCWTAPLIGPLVGVRPENAVGFQLCDAHGGDPLEWPERLRVRNFPEARL
jgi:protein gp37